MQRCLLCIVQYLFSLIKYSEAKVPSLFITTRKIPFSMRTVPSPYNVPKHTLSQVKWQNRYNKNIYLYIAHTWTVTETGVTAGVSLTGDMPTLGTVTRARVLHRALVDVVKGWRGNNVNRKIKSNILKPGLLVPSSICMTSWRSHGSELNTPVNNPFGPKASHAWRRSVAPSLRMSKTDGSPY